MNQPPKRARITAVTSGKGGVGKTVLSANLAAALAARGERVLVLDAVNQPLAVLARMHDRTGTRIPIAAIAREP